MKTVDQLHEELIALEAEVTIVTMNLSRLAAKCEFVSAKIFELLKTNDEPEMFDTGEPTSAYVNQDR